MRDSAILASTEDVERDFLASYRWIRVEKPRGAATSMRKRLTHRAAGLADQLRARVAQEST